MRRVRVLLPLDTLILVSKPPTICICPYYYGVFSVLLQNRGRTVGSGGCQWGGRGGWRAAGAVRYDGRTDERTAWWPLADGDPRRPDGAALGVPLGPATPFGRNMAIMAQLIFNTLCTFLPFFFFNTNTKIYLHESLL